MTSQTDKAIRLAQYIGSLDNFELMTEFGARYDHMGATISEAGLQRAINYKTVVRPRTKSILARYPDAKTTSDFQRLLEEVGPGDLLSWKGLEKINTIVDVTSLFVAEGVETVSELHTWLLQEGNLERLRQVKGIGPKTADLFKKMAGIPSSVIDRHVYNFLARAGVPASSYHEAQETVNAAADLLEVSYSALDDGIWKYMMDEVD